MIFSNELLTFIGWCSEYWVTVAIEYFGNDPDSEGLETFVRGSKKMNHVWKLLILLIFVFTEFFIAESLSCSFSVHLPFSEFVLSVYMTTTCMLLSFFLCWKNPFILLSDLLNWCAFPASISSRLNFSQINWIFCSHRSLTLKLSMSLRKLSQRIVFPLPSF